MAYTDKLAGARLPEDHVIDGHSFAPLLRGESFRPRQWIYSYLGDRRVVRTKRWLLEDNSPSHYGRLYDCGTSRDGTGYREVTDSQDPRVVAARKLLEGISADKPVPRTDLDRRTIKPKTKPKKPGRI